MRILPISEINKLGDGETVPSLTGRLTSIFDVKSGTNAKGEWSIQNATLRDGTGEIKVSIRNRAEIPRSWKGREVVIACNDGEHGLTGIKASDDTYREKTSRIVCVTGSAHIDLVEGSPAPQYTPPPAPMMQAPRQTQPPTNGNSNGASAPVDSVKAARKDLNRMANLYLHCLHAADYVRAEWDKDVEIHGVMSDEQFQACTSSLFIQSTRDGLLMSIPTGSFGK